MSAIANAALVLTTQAADLYSGMSKAGAAIKSWAGSTAANVGGMFGGIARGVAGALTAAVGLAVTQFGVMEARIKSLADIGRTAKSLGIASDVFLGLTNNAKRFGVEASDITTALTKLAAHMEGGGKGTESFGKALNSIGVDIQGMKVDAAFLAIASAIYKIGDPAKQAAAALEIFGKQGVMLLPILQQGRGAIEAFIAAQRAKGILISPQDMNALMEAKKEIPRLGEVWDAVWNRVTIAALPVIRTINQQLTEGLNKIIPVLTKVGEVASGAFDAMASGIGNAITHIGTLIDQMGQMAGSWKENEAATTNWGDVAVAMSGYVAKGFGYVYDAVKSIVGALMWVTGKTIETAGMMVQVLGKAWTTIGEILPDSAGGEYFKGWGRMAGKGAEEIKNWGGALGEVGGNMFMEFGDSAKKVDKWTDDMLAKRITDREKAKNAAPEIKTPELPKTIDYHAAGAFQQGSKEAYSIESAFKVGGMVNKPVERQLEETKKHTNILIDIRNDLRQKLTDRDPDDIGVV